MVPLYLGYKGKLLHIESKNCMIDLILEFGEQYLMKSCKTLKGGLQEVADDLQVRSLYSLIRIIS